MPSKGITLRERAYSQTRATLQASSERYTTPQHTFLSKINTENKAGRKVNPPGSHTIPAKLKKQLRFHSSQNKVTQQNFKEPAYKGKGRQAWHHIHCSFRSGDSLIGTMFTAHSLLHLTTGTARENPGSGNVCAHPIAKGKPLTLIKPLSRQMPQSRPLAF